MELPYGAAGSMVLWRLFSSKVCLAYYDITYSRSGVDMLLDTIMSISMNTLVYSPSFAYNTRDQIKPLPMLRCTEYPTGYYLICLYSYSAYDDDEGSGEAHTDLMS